MTFSNLAIMAWRNLWRNRRRTVITLNGVAFGVMLAILFTGLGDYSFGRMIDLAARSGSGHITFQHPEYLDKPSLRKTISDIPSLKRIVLQNKDVNRAVARIIGQTMLATATENQPAFFVGIDPKAEDDTTLGVIGGLIRGKMFKSTKDNGIILGERLAKNLDLTMGRKVVYTMTDKRGELVSGLARVSGVIRTGAPTVDGSLCLLPIDSLREILSYSHQEATQLALFVNDQRLSESVADAYRSQIGKHIAVITWRQSRPELAAFISMKVAGTQFFEIVIMIVLAAGVFNTFFVSVMERKREFGILMAIGFKPVQLFSLVMLESLWLSIIGLLLAGLVTAWPYTYMNTKGIDLSVMVGRTGSEVAGVVMESVLYVDIFMNHVVTIAGVVIFATLLSGLYPAWRAGKMPPVESIKLV